ncbi:MAG: hypothetical protein K9I95_14740 [Flavobacteriaceae bacterium]|nr:hypothetical protein [Flavobacteriaceae bacterium]
MKKIFNILIYGLLIIGCSKEDVIHVDNQTEDNNYSFNISDQPAFLVGENTGANYYNDITVGVIAYTGNSIKLLTSSGTQTVMFMGSDLEHITSVETKITPNLYEENSYFRDYIGAGQLIKDKNGKIYSIVHGEWHNGKIINYNNVPGFYASIGLATSVDGGETFQMNHTPIIPDFYGWNHDSGQADSGLAEPSITFNKDSTAVFVYYGDHNRTGRNVNINMVKFDVSKNGIPDFTKCYFLKNDNTFTTALIRSKEVVVGPEIADALFPQVTFNKTTNTFLMVYCLNDYDEYFKTGQPTKSGIYLRESEDGINWSKPPQKIKSGWAVPFNTTTPYMWHPTLIYSNSSQTEGYLLFSQSLNGLVNDGHKMWAQKFQIKKAE